MNFDPQEGDVIIRRVQNGWIAIVAGSDDFEGIPGTAVSTVHEDDERYGSAASSASFLALLQERFVHLFQSKHRGGIVARFAPVGREEEG